MPTDWNEWNHTSACLNELENGARWLEQDAAKVQHAVTHLRMRPDFETRAEGQLDHAEKALRLALALVLAAKGEYQGKPTDQHSGPVVVLQ